MLYPPKCDVSNEFKELLRIIEADYVKQKLTRDGISLKEYRSFVLAHVRNCLEIGLLPSQIYITESQLPAEIDRLLIDADRQKALNRLADPSLFVFKADVLKKLNELNKMISSHSDNKDQLSLRIQYTSKIHSIISELGLK